MRLLVRVDRGATTDGGGGCSRGVASTAGLVALRLHQRLPRRLRARAVPPVPAAASERPALRFDTALTYSVAVPRCPSMERAAPRRAAVRDSSALGTGAQRSADDASWPADALDLRAAAPRVVDADRLPASHPRGRRRRRSRALSLRRTA